MRRAAKTRWVSKATLIKSSKPIGLQVQTAARPLYNKEIKMATRAKKVGSKNAALRDNLWSDLNKLDLWDRTRQGTVGFTTVPRTLPIVMNIIDDLTKTKPASKAYLSLWMQAYDEMYVSLKNADDMAFQSGFVGQRAVRTWKERVKSLAELGFIRVATGSRGALSHAVIMNPHFVVRRLHAAETAGLTDAAYNTLVERANEIGATDMDDVLPENRPAIPFSQIVPIVPQTVSATPLSLPAGAKFPK